MLAKIAPLIRIHFMLGWNCDHNKAERSVKDRVDS